MAENLRNLANFFCHCEASAHTGCGNPYPSSLISFSGLSGLGKGANLIAGYNTASYEEKSKTDEKKLLKAMSIFMFVLAGCFLVSALSLVLHVKSLIWIGQALFVVALIVGLIYLNTGDRFKR